MSTEKKKQPGARERALIRRCAELDRAWLRAQNREQKTWLACGEALADLIQFRNKCRRTRGHKP